MSGWERYKSERYDSLKDTLRGIYARIKRLARRIRNLFRGTKDPWDDIETNARLYVLRRGNGLSGDDVRNEFANKIRQNPPTDFGQVVRLMQLITENPVILTPLRCLQCGANLHLPSSGLYVECNHCGYNYHVANITEMLEKILG